MTLHSDLLNLHSENAERLSTPRKINGVAFDGSQDITISGGGGGSGNATSIAGIPVVISGISQGDNLQYAGGDWVNTPLVDGGNF